MKKWSWIITVLFLVLILAVGCGTDDEETVDADDEEENTEEDMEEENTELGDYEVQFSGDVKEEDNVFIIDGKSNLLKDARIIGEVVVDDGETVFSDTSELVTEDGSFHMELDHHEYGDAEIFIRFEFEGMQEDEIKRHYGEKGQNLEGPFIYKYSTNLDDNLRKAEVRIPYQTGEQNDLAIKAPECEELPDDYGDPRVWIETEEVTEDGEFFYITGKSNLIEGAELEAQYAGNRGKTRVLPDGTFDLKFDYEYREDQELLILFKPYDYSQWNDVQEAYGKSGQNLVGNLVATKDYSTDQYIRKVVDWDDNESDFGGDDEDREDDEIDAEDEEQDIDDEEDNKEDDEQDMEDEDEE